MPGVSKSDSNKSFEISSSCYILKNFVYTYILDVHVSSSNTLRILCKLRFVQHN